MEKATFAGGCFWCMVQPFDTLPGIHTVLSGYMGGHVLNPTYKDVKTGESGHYEVVQITYDPTIFPYERLLELFWPQIDPTDDGGQFHDRGPQYRTAIFVHNEAQRQLAQMSKNALAASGRFKHAIVTEIKDAETFYVAEEEHQYYYKTSNADYKADRAASGRDEFIENHWK
ncbi:MAG: peptide-methionine (S)-S-oxide reductase MsrA [Bacilli bacterium]